MRIVSAAKTAAWKDSLKASGTRPVVRATIQRASQKVTPYNTADVNGEAYGGRDRHGVYTSAQMGYETRVFEIPNIKSYSWSRSVDQDVAECTMTILNTQLTPIGNQELAEQSGDFDLPGALTYNRGIPTESANRWGYALDLGWKNIFVPDRIVRTYEGYGADHTVTPAYDPNLEISGTWLIDKVDYAANGDIVLRMRDLGRMLVDQIAFPPIVPPSEYPMRWETIHNINVAGRDATGGSWKFPSGTYSSSNQFYVGQGIVSRPSPYISANGTVDGHQERHAVTARYGDYWLSTGQKSEKDKVWWQCNFYDKTTNIAGVRLNTFRGPYRVFVSLYDKDRGWLGERNIPYRVTTEGVDIGADIPFVQAFDVPRRVTDELILKRKYANISRIRITITNLNHQGGTGWVTHPWRAGLFNVRVYTAPSIGDLGFDTSGTVLKVLGNISDYTHIVKWIAAWGGFYWPETASGDHFMMLENGTKMFYPQPSPDTVVMPKGRIWGRFQPTGTSPVATLTADQFDKQPLMDCIGVVRDITGFNFWVDELGAIVWRMPNLWSLGNYVTPHHLSTARFPARSSADDLVTIDEEETLIDYSTALDSSNIRERIFIAGTTGKVGTVIKGFNPFPSGFRRIAGWTDSHFLTKQECRVMADMISAKQMFTYRTSRVTIPGHPAIQIDDQVRIYERVTNETYYHYVRGITSSLDMETGVWTYDLDTHWLGENPSAAWAVKVTELPGVTQQYLNTIGAED